jgi:lysine 6-dehydrogenase
MKALVIGAGMMGSAMAYDLAQSDGVERVLLADIDAERARSVASAIGGSVEPHALDTRDAPAVTALMRRADLVLGATSYTHNVQLTDAAIDAGVHFCDLGGNMDVVYEQMRRDERAKAAGVLVLPNCGLAPGMACVVAAGGAARFDAVDEIHIRVGGLPQHPLPPLNYQLVFSAEGLINEYLEPAEVLAGGEPRTVPSMTDLERLSFKAPYAELEAFHTSGGVSTLVGMFRAKAQTLDYKTIRYAGHCEKFRTLLDLGFASSEPIMVGSTVRTAREIFEEMLRRKLPANGPDVVLMRVTVKGRMGGAEKTLAYEMTDHYDEGLRITAMMRTTAFPTSVIAQMVVRGAIPERGVLPPERCVPLAPFLAELGKRNIVITESLS